MSDMEFAPPKYAQIVQAIRQRIADGRYPAGSLLPSPAALDPSARDATIAALQLIIAGDQYNTISKPSEIVAAAAANVAVQLMAGETPKADTTLFNTPSKLFVPAVITAENLKAEIIDKKINTAEQLCSGRYAEGCKKLGITQ